MSLKRPTSSVWGYFKKSDEENKPQCLKCFSKVTNAKGTTGAPINHLKLIHKITLSSSVES